MELATIEATPEEAKAKLDEYRAAVRENHNKTDEMILRGYKELEKGRSLMRLTDSIKSAGAGDKYLPRLAVARAIDNRVRCRVDSQTTTFWPESMNVSWWGPRSQAGLNSGVVRLTIDRPELSGRGDPRGSAIVPLIPPMLRPARALYRYFILFEAEWDRIPPKDPALIRHLIGDLWVVVATWDLTELERAAIATR